MRRAFLGAFLGAFALVCGATAFVIADDKKAETPDDSYPRVLVINFHANGNAACKALEPKLAKLRPTFEDKEVLFVTVDLSSRSSRHQTKLLLNVLGLGTVSKAYATKPGHVVLIDVSTSDTIKAFDSAVEPAAIEAALNKALTPPKEEDEEPEDDDGGMDDDGG